MRDKYQEEKGTTDIKTSDGNHKMIWIMRRSRGESAFGIRGSRIFELTIIRDGKMSARYERGWIKQIDADDEASSLCLTHIMNSYGKEKRKKDKEESNYGKAGSQERGTILQRIRGERDRQGSGQVDDPPPAD